MGQPDTPGPAEHPTGATSPTGDGAGGFLDVDADLAQDGDLPPSQDVPAADDSPLTSLRARLAAVVLTFDLEVPRLDPPVYVRYKAVSQRRVEEIGRLVDRRREKDKTVVFNATVLADACQGIFEVIDGEKVSVDHEDRGGDWPKFDQRLAELLGVRAKKAVELVRVLYKTDGDLITAAQKLVELSGFDSGPEELDDPGN